MDVRYRNEMDLDTRTFEMLDFPGFYTNVTRRVLLHYKIILLYICILKLFQICSTFILSIYLDKYKQNIKIHFLL